MTRPRRKYARAIEPITDAVTGEVLGWLYEWDDGTRAPLLVAHLHPRFEDGPDRGRTGAAQV